MARNIYGLTEEWREALSEVDEILEHSSSNVLNKIPRDFKVFVNHNKSSYYDPKFDHSKRLSQLHLMNKTKEIIALIYTNFLSNEGQKLDDTGILDNSLIDKKMLKENSNFDRRKVSNKKRKEVNNG